MSNTQQHQPQEFRSADSVRAVLRVRTLGPSGLNPPQIEVMDRLQTLSEDEDGLLDDLNINMWIPSIGLTQTEHRIQETHVKQSPNSYTGWMRMSTCVFE